MYTHTHTHTHTHTQTLTEMPQKELFCKQALGDVDYQKSKSAVRMLNSARFNKIECHAELKNPHACLVYCYTQQQSATINFHILSCL